PDGSFSVSVQVYRGSVPNGQETTSPSYSYALSAFSLEELIVSVNEPIQIVSAPTNETILEGQTLYLSVAVTGSSPQYQWYKDGQPIPDATNRFYHVYPALPSDSGSYYVSVWNNINSTNTPPVNITVVSEPIVITNGLRDIDVFEASTVVLTIGASGTFQHYQWFKDGVPIDGATNVSLTITNFAPENDGTYSVVVSNTTSQASSSGKLTYVPDTIPPRIIAAVASSNYMTIDVIFSEPVSTEAADPFSYQLYPDVGVPVFPTTAALTSPTNATLTFLAGDIQFGRRYTIVPTGIMDLSRQSNPIVEVPKQVAMYYVTMLTIDNLATWKFESRGVDWSNVWYRLDFDDSGWSNGMALFEAKDGTIPALPEPVRTIMNISNMQATARVRTYYFRTWFDFPGNDPTNSAIAIRTVIDDGAVFYLNGKEIYRLGMPSGTITYSTLASRTVGDAAYEGPFTIYLPGLVAGSNLVAVEVHQASATSSDVTMGLQIIGILPALTPVEILTPLTDKTINEGESLTLSVEVKGASPQFQWYKDGVPIDGATNSFYPIVNAKPNMSGVYKVVVQNMVNTVETSALITVTPDTTPPAVLSAVANTNLTTITLTFSEPLDPFSAQDPANYAIAPVGGGAALDIMNVILQNWTNVIITTTPMQNGVIYEITINGVADTSEAANTLMNHKQTVLATTFIMPVWVDWKYENTGTDLGTNWFEPSFDDSSWQSGAALFGLETSGFVDNNPINTPFALTNASGTFIPTFYFRKWFVFPYKTDGVKIAFAHAVDDGAVFYINGVEVYRYNMPSGQIGFNTLSASSIDVSDYTISPFITVTNLVSGPNLLAVEVHQGSLTSSDVLFGAGILAQLPSFEIVYVESPRLEYSVDGNTIIFTWSAPGFRLQQNPDLNTSNWIDVPDGSQSPAAVPILNTNMFFRLVK
ncbi:MAG: immunoglobulin domain-containing protein, partial [Verrucomicrobiia bacterium]